MDLLTNVLDRGTLQQVFLLCHIPWSTFSPSVSLALLVGESYSWKRTAAWCQPRPPAKAYSAQFQKSSVVYVESSCSELGMTITLKKGNNLNRVDEQSSKVYEVLSSVLWEASQTFPRKGFSSVGEIVNLTTAAGQLELLNYVTVPFFGLKAAMCLICALHKMNLSSQIDEHQFGSEEQFRNLRILRRQIILTTSAVTAVTKPLIMTR